MNATRQLAQRLRVCADNLRGPVEGTLNSGAQAIDTLLDVIELQRGAPVTPTPPRPDLEPLRKLREWHVDMRDRHRQANIPDHQNASVGVHLEAIRTLNQYFTDQL